jgi:transcriptional regulator with XRE-family HTH domain
MAQRVSVQRQRIGPAIRKLRRQKDLTLDDLATQAGISASHLSRLERGQTLPSFTVLAQIAHVLDASVDAFVQLEQDVTALDKEFGGSLDVLGFSPEARREMLSSSIELRRAVMETLRALSMTPTTTRQKQDEAVRAIMEQDIPGASPALNRAIRGVAINGVAFTRALMWVLSGSSDVRVLAAEPGLIGFSDEDLLNVYRAVAGGEPIDLQVMNWWSSGGPWQDLRARVILQRDVLSRYYRGGVWIKGANPVPPQRVAQNAERVASYIEDGSLQLALTDAELGEVNLLIGDSDVLLESARYRASDDEQARLGLLVRGRAGADAFAQRYDQLWDSLSDSDKDSAANARWIREHAALVGAGRA